MRQRRHLHPRVLPHLLALLIAVGDFGIGTPAEASANARLLWNSDDGGVQMALGRDQRCDTGWVCLYEHINWNRHRDGRMLRFRDNRWQQLSVRGFNDKTSSWRNRSGRNACLSWDWPASGSLKLKLERGSSAEMGR